MQSFRPFGFQTGTNDPSERSSFATSMIYNPHNEKITIIGGTYGQYFQPGIGNGIEKNERRDSDCFVAVQHLRDPNQLSWVRRRQYGNPFVSEFCSDIYARKRGRYIAVGHSGENGVLSHLRSSGNTRRSVYGMLLDIDESIELHGGVLLHANEVQYPVAVTTNESGDEIFIAEIFSDTKPDASQLEAMMNGALVDGGHDYSASAYAIPSLGLNFAIRLKKVTSLDHNIQTTLGSTTIANWSRSYGTMGMENVQVSTLDYISPSILMLTGFTRGEGEAVGKSSDIDAGTLDSFIMLIDPSSGQLLKSKRIESIVPGDDKILGTCLGKNATEVYIVGMTSGIFDSKYLYQPEDPSLEHQVYAFIQRIDLDDMNVVWSRQLGAIYNNTHSFEANTIPQIHGLACTVTPDGEEIFMGGNVKDGASLVVPTGESVTTGGETDIFVAKFGTKEGDLLFTTQIGSSGNDSLATRKSLSTDTEGNLILLGNTNGQMFREKSQNTTTDIFTMSVGRANGDFIYPFDSPSRNTNVDGSTYLSGSFFEQRYHDPIKQARYETAMATVLTLFCLAFVILCATTIYFVRKTNEQDKGKAVGGASMTTFRSETEKSDYDSVLFSAGDKGTLSVHSSCSLPPKTHPSSNFGFVRPSLETNPVSVIVPRGIRSSRISDDKYFGYDASDFPDDLGSIRSIVGNRRFQKSSPSTAEKLVGSLSRESARNRSYHAGNDEPKRNTDDSNLYEEIYDLLSLASERLGFGSDIDSDLDPPQSTTSRRKSYEEMSLDDIWDMELV